MTILTLKPDALTVPEFDYATIYPWMGNNESGATIMEAPTIYQQWAWRGYFGMGFRLYGDNLNTTFLDAWNTGTPAGSDTDKVNAKRDIQTTWANRIIPWFEACAASDNTCTNAALRVTNGQCYTLDDTGVWSRQGTIQSNVESCTGYTIVAGATSGGYACATLFKDTINVPAFPFCPTSGDWSASSSDTSKYRLLHTDLMSRITLSDPTALRGVLVTFESQLVSTNGSAFNGTPKFLIQAGCDAGYDNDIVGSGILNGAPYSPGLGGGRWAYINTDGTRRRHYFATFLHANSSQDLTSTYNAGGGASVQTAAEFFANMPRRFYQPTL